MQMHKPLLACLLFFCQWLIAASSSAAVYNGNVNGYVDDWIPITLSADTQYTITMTVTGGINGYAGYYLYDASKTVSLYSGGAPTNPSPSSPNALKAGSYWIQVWVNNRWAVGSYTITTTETPAPLVNDANNNDSKANASSATLGAANTGHIGYFDGKTHNWDDWWRIVLPNDGAFSIDFAVSGTSGDSDFKANSGYELVDDKGVQYSYSGVSLPTPYSPTSLAAGTYYLHLYVNRAWTYGSYTFTPTLAGCSYILSPSKATISSAGGSGTVAVTASSSSCTWTASAPQGSGASISSGSSGQGNGNVTYWVDANTQAASRAVTLSIAGQSLTITQDGASAANASTTDLMSAGSWRFYGSGSVMNGTLTVGDNIGYDCADSDGDGNPYNTWFNGSASAPNCVDYDEAISTQEFSPPFKLSWTGCFPETSAGYDNIVIGRKNPLFTGAANSKQYLISQEFGFSTRWDKTGMNSFVLSDVRQVTGANATSQGYCADYRIEWANDLLQFYYNGSKVREETYAYVAPVSIVIRSFEKPHTISAIKVESNGVATPTTAQIDCLFNWGEDSYPTLLTPARSASLTSAPYYYRYYPGTNTYLGVSATDQHLYYLAASGPGGLQDLGAAATWLGMAGCK